MNTNNFNLLYFYVQSKVYILLKRIKCAFTFLKIFNIYDPSNVSSLFHNVKKVPIRYWKSIQDHRHNRFCIEWKSEFSLISNINNFFISFIQFEVVFDAFVTKIKLDLNIRKLFALRFSLLKNSLYLSQIVSNIKIGFWTNIRFLVRWLNFFVFHESCKHFYFVWTTLIISWILIKTNNFTR